VPLHHRRIDDRCKKEGLMFQGSAESREVTRYREVVAEDRSRHAEPLRRVLRGVMLTELEELRYRSSSVGVEYPVEYSLKCYTVSTRGAEI